MTDGLKDKHRRAVIDILAANSRVERVTLFGSRAMGTFTTTSDVDLALYGEELSLTDHIKLAAAIDELPMAQRVDLLLYNTIDNKKLKEHIKKHGVEWFRRSGGKGFKLTTLGKYARVQGGFAYKSKDFSEYGIYPILKIKNIRFGHIDYSDTVFINANLAKETSDWATKEGDILISMTGSGPNAPQSLVGRVARVWKDEPRAWINQRVGRFQLKSEGSIHTDFLFYLLSSPRSQEYLVSNSSGSANQANISGKIIESLPCPKVNYEQSAAIAKVLKEIDEKILMNRQINQTLEEMAQAIFKSWFVDFEPVKAKIRAKEEWKSKNGELKNDNPELAKQRTQFINRAAMRAISGAVHGCTNAAGAGSAGAAKTDEELDQLSPAQLAQLRATVALFPDELADSELGLIPKGWEVKPLDEIAHYQNGLALQKFRPENEKDFLPVVKIAQLKAGAATYDEKASPDIKPACIIDNGDVVFSWSGSLLVDLWCGGKAALNQHLFKVTSETYPKWFYYYWTKHHLAAFQQIAADKAVTMGHIKRSHLKEALCSVPNVNFEVFGSIGDFLAKQVEMRLESVTLAQLRDTLLPKLLSGEIKVTEAKQTAEAVA